MDDAPEPKPSRTILLTAEPQLFVADMAAATEFYGEKLGFSVVFLYGDPPYYGQVRRDGVRLNLRCLRMPILDPARRDREELLSASITLEDAAPLFREYRAAGVPFAAELKKQPWGASTFIVRDPDGNLVLFTGREE